MRPEHLLADSPPLRILRETQTVSYSEGTSISIYQQMKIQHFKLVAAVTILTWDIIVTLSEEVSKNVFRR